MKKSLTVILLACSLFSQAQVGIGTPTANAAAALDITSTSKGALFPRMTATQRTAMNPLPAAAQGLVVYQTTSPEGFYYNTSTTTVPNWLYLANTSTSTPSGTIVAYGGSTAPSGWAFCNGQNISRTTYASLFTAIGTTYGFSTSADFNVPDLRGRTAFGKDDMGGAAAAGRITSANGLDGATLGAGGGAQTQTISAANLPSHNHAVSLATSSNGDHSHNYNDAYFAENGGANVGGNSRFGTAATTDNDNSFRFRTSSDTHTDGKSDIPTSTTGAHTHSVSGNTANTGSGTAMPVVNPALVLNYIIKL